MRLVHLTRAACLALLLCGCDLLTGVEEERYRGWIGHPDDLQISVPEVVVAGQPFNVTVRTAEPDGCWRKGETVVQVVERSATITPYNVLRRSGAACPDGVVEIMHTAAITFAAPGNAEVIVRGRDGTATRQVSVAAMALSQ